MVDVESPDETDDTTGVDEGMARAGAAAAARRRELDISQRSLASEGIINAGALIAFEKGRSWPREATRAKLEELLRWPPGTIERIRYGRSAGSQRAPDPQAADEGSLIAQAIETALGAMAATIDSLPPTDNPTFTPRLTAILSDLRQLEQVAARATQIGRMTPPLLKALSTVRRRIDELTMHGATAPNATIGQLLYAARRRANLTIAETAQAAGVAEESVIATESGKFIPLPELGRLAALVDQLDWR